MYYIGRGQKFERESKHRRPALRELMLERVPGLIRIVKTCNEVPTREPHIQMYCKDEWRGLPNEAGFVVMGESATS
ncbi:hypothetical protein BaRGS_00026024 [Batillaria attramentaria]|uniref:Uncharacterized protein n=1 Tax=Batillaria attramentaria TaxID=370345 RepID=A0ABD0K6Y4_9CAEN